MRARYCRADVEFPISLPPEDFMTKIVRGLAALVLLILLTVPAAWAQSQAVNGSIEGLVTDTTGAVLPGATVTVANADTGMQRVVPTDPSGFYRAALLPLGTYRV